MASLEPAPEPQNARKVHLEPAPEPQNARRVPLESPTDRMLDGRRSSHSESQNARRVPLEPALEPQQDQMPLRLGGTRRRNSKDETG